MQRRLQLEGREMMIVPVQVPELLPDRRMPIT
jgi:hypothetical protein